MASSNTGNAALFGDSDSSDESVEPTKTVSSAADEAPANDDNEETKNGQRQDGNAASNANLFGDDDSSDDDEFDGDAGIVGRSAGGDGAGEVEAAKPQTMSERLGLDSDSDDDKQEANQNKDGENLPESKPIYVPPRKMELLNLAYEKHTTASNIPPSLHIVKLPNLVGINYTAYNAKTHNLEDEEEYYRGYVHNMIRWRYKYHPDDDTQLIRDEEGHPVRESNTRLVKWSDGSYTLHVGQEVLEVDNLDSSVPLDAEGGGAVLPGFAGINGYLYVSQKARVRPPSKKEMMDPDNNNETNDGSMEEEEDDPPAQPAGTVLECLGPITSRFAPRPSSLASEAHRNLTLAVRQRNVKRARIAEIVTDFDPEKEKQARIKGKDDLAKSQTRSGRRSGGGGGGRHRGTTSSYRDEDENYDGVNLRKLKRQTMQREYGNDEEDEVMDYGEDSDEEEDEWSKNKKRKRGAALQAARASSAREKVQKKKGGVGDFDEDNESSEEGEVVFGEDDDEEEEGALFKKRASGGAKKADFLDDDDDE